ncbi:hypothetical protein [Dyadobacter sp. BHUBP1]|uniref:hypothetical protein n=1 Tax=Dyadobacter sp. BHUBP1 TaxID=3424178 RepID=UPI003D34C62A
MLSVLIVSKGILSSFALSLPILAETGTGAFSSNLPRSQATSWINNNATHNTSHFSVLMTISV